MRILDMIFYLTDFIITNNKTRGYLIYKYIAAGIHTMYLKTTITTTASRGTNISNIVPIGRRIYSVI